MVTVEDYQTLLFLMTFGGLLFSTSAIRYCRQ